MRVGSRVRVGKGVSDGSGVNVDLMVGRLVWVGAASSGGDVFSISVVGVGEGAGLESKLHEREVRMITRERFRISMDLDMQLFS